jgi:GntR family transcriptional repressor for pyruvate dehydrogenase complex
LRPGAREGSTLSEPAETPAETAADAAAASLPIERTNLQEAVTRRILDIIRGAALQPGDRLPPARALAERCAVAVPTVREALRRLEATGVVEIRHGSGIYLRPSFNRVVLPNPNLATLHRDTISDLLQARILLEPPMAALAAERAADAELDELGSLLNTAEACVRARDDTTLHEINMSFNRRITTLSGNKVVSQILDSLTQVYRPEQREILDLYNDRKRDYAEHRQILDALHRHASEDAHDLMRHHLADVRAIVDGHTAAGPSASAGTAEPAVRPRNDAPGT